MTKRELLAVGLDSLMPAEIKNNPYGLEAELGFLCRENDEVMIALSLKHRAFSCTHSIVTTEISKIKPLLLGFYLEAVSTIIKDDDIKLTNADRFISKLSKESADNLATAYCALCKTCKDCPIYNPKEPITLDQCRDNLADWLNKEEEEND